MRNTAAAGLLASVGYLVLAGTVLGQDPGLWQQHMEGAKKAYREGNQAVAEQLLLQARQDAEKFGPDDFRMGITLHNLANLAATRGHGDEAEPLYHRAVSILEKDRGSDHPQVAVALVGLADLYSAEGKYADAEPHYQRAVGIFEKSLGSEHPIVVTVLERYVTLLRKSKRPQEADKLEARLQEIRTRQAPAGKPSESTVKNSKKPG